MGDPKLTFDLVVATVERVAPLDVFLRSVAEQDIPGVRVLVVDQNRDERLTEVLNGHPSLTIERLRAQRGLSRARNTALPHLRADVVAFPDDDCVYRPGLLADVARRLEADSTLGGLTGREVAPDGSSSPSWERRPAILTADTLWNRAISFTIFLRRETLASAGPFDERLGLGAGDGPWESGEEIDLLIRAVANGARIAYDPELTVEHPLRAVDDTHDRDTALARRDGASVGYLLRKHRYPVSTVGRMLARPCGGAALAAVKGDFRAARVQVETLRGRITGLRGGGASDV